MMVERNWVNDEEIEQYARVLASYREGQTDESAFTALRLQNGIYGERQPGVHMIRVKLPGGRLTPGQLEAIAEALEHYSEDDAVHITTRQDIQLHHVPLAHTPAVLRRLAREGLTTREACGNTVRNMTACPLAGVCPHEHTDVTAFLRAAAGHFLRHPLTQTLPRKFKISFSGCGTDCAQALIHDLGVIAVRDAEGRPGFRLLAGGGLGHKPREAIVIEPFLPEHELLPAMEALLVLHNRHSDRLVRARSRIKFLVDRFGPEDFVARYRQEFARTREAWADRPHPRGEWRHGEDAAARFTGALRRPQPQRQAGLHAWPVSVPRGLLTERQLRGIATAARDVGVDGLRTTQDQNLVLLSVPEAHGEALRGAIERLGLGGPRVGDGVVACPGTSSCRLGITSSMVLATRLSGGPSDLRLRVSGCHNGCAQPETGDIGIYGEGRRLHGRLIPHYRMYFGGDGRDGGGLAIAGPSVPAARVGQAITRVQEAYAAHQMQAAVEMPFAEWARQQGSAYFEHQLADLAQVSASDVPSVIRDHGYASDFAVVPLGGGECGGAAQEGVAAKFFEAGYERECRDAFTAQRKLPQAVECAEAMLGLVGEAVLQAGRRGPAAPGPAVGASSPFASLAPGLAALAAQMEEVKTAFDEAGFTRLTAALDAWVSEATRSCAAADPRLAAAVTRAGGAKPGGVEAGDTRRTTRRAGIAALQE